MTPTALLTFIIVAGTAWLGESLINHDHLRLGVLAQKLALALAMAWIVIGQPTARPESCEQPGLLDAAPSQRAVRRETVPGLIRSIIRHNIDLRQGDTDGVGG